MSKYIYIVLLLVFLSHNLFGSIEFTLREKEYLNDRNYFTILVSSNNYPYEYIDDYGTPAGVNIEYIKEILAFSGHKLIFRTEFEDALPDIISSFAVQRPNYTLKTPPLFVSDVYFLYDKSKNFDTMEYFVAINQSAILNQLLQRFPNQKHIMTDNILKSKTFFDTHKDLVLAFDSFSKMYLGSRINTGKNMVIERQPELSLAFYLNIQDKNQVLYTIISKSILELEKNNHFYQIFKKYQKHNEQVFFLHKYEGLIQIATVIILFFLIFVIYFIYKYKIFRFQSEKLIMKYNEENSLLEQKIETLSYQLETVRTTNYNFLQKLNNLTFLLDLKGNIISINDFSKSILGYSPEELIGQNIDKIVSKENKQKLLNLSNIENTIRTLQMIHDTIENQNPFEIEIYAKDGLKKNFIFTSFLTKNIKGYTEINCILLNISDRKILQNKFEALNSNFDDMIKQRIKSLQESEEKFKFVIEKAYNGIFVMQNNYFTLVNDALTVTTGYPKSSFLERLIKFSDIIDPEDYDSVMDKVQDNIRKKIDYFIIQTKVKNYLGELTDVEIHFSITHNDDESIILGVINDISTKIEYEEKKLQSEKLNTLTQYAITTNDKINSPLNAISGYVELLELTNSNPTQSQTKAYQNIYESINIIKQVLHKLKSLTKISQQNYNFAGLKMIDVNFEFTNDTEENPNEE